MTSTDVNAPAIFRIRVQGRIDPRWADSFGGMNITEAGRRGAEPETVLVGRLGDQTALMGVINALTDAHVTLLSIDRLETG